VNSAARPEGGGVLLAVHAGLAVHSLRQNSQTVDEGGQLLSGPLGSKRKNGNGTAMVSNR